MWPHPIDQYYLPHGIIGDIGEESNGRVKHDITPYIWKKFTVCDILELAFNVVSVADSVPIFYKTRLIILRDDFPFNMAGLPQSHIKLK